MIIDRDFLRGNFLRAASRGDRKQRLKIRRLIRNDGDLDILAWMVNSGDTPITPPPGQGSSIGDWLQWFVDNLPQLLELLAQIVGFFNGIPLSAEDRVDG